MDTINKKIKILILEDNPYDADLIIRTLTRAGISIDSRVVDTRQEYADALLAFSPTLILSDHQLPDFSSNEALAAARKVFPFVPFILVTGTVSEEFAASIIKAGADDYLLKNNLGRLPHAVQQALEKKATERKLKTVDERLLFHIDNTPLGFIEWDEHFQVKSWSKRATEIFGWTEDELKQQMLTGFNLVFEDDKERVSQLARMLRSGELQQNNVQCRYYTKDRRVIWCEWFNSVLKDENDKVITVMSLVQDITDRKNAEENLEIVINRFRQAQQVAHLGHWEINYRTGRIVWSAETFRIFGLAPDTTEPSEESFLSFIHPDDIGKFRSITESSRKEFSAFSLYHRILHSDGNIRNIYSAAHYEFDHTGQPLGLYGILLDVTELTEKERELEQASRELETFIYKTYHDLRSPIVTILGVANLARKEVKDEKALQYFSIINEVTMKQNKMLVNLVKVMSIRDRQLIVEPVEMKSLLNETLHGLETMDNYKNIKFTLHENLANRVLTDRELIFNMLFQLIENSILYRNPNQPESEISIYISHDNPDNILLEIVDNGIGMAPGVADRVFDMFYRGTNLSKGSGLGLYLVKNAVEKLNGTISLSSKQNKGSTFRITFPARAESQISGKRQSDEITS